MFPLLPVQKILLWWVNLINKGIWFCFGLLTEEALFLDRETNYWVCVSLNPAPLCTTSSNSPGSHMSLRGLNHWTNVTLLLLCWGCSESFEAVTECFVWSTATFAFQSVWAFIASEQHALPQGGHLSCWGLPAHRVTTLWSEEMSSDHRNCYLILWAFCHWSKECVLTSVCKASTIIMRFNFHVHWSIACNAFFKK